MAGTRFEYDATPTVHEVVQRLLPEINAALIASGAIAGGLATGLASLELLLQIAPKAPKPPTKAPGLGDYDPADEWAREQRRMYRRAG